MSDRLVLSSGEFRCVDFGDPECDEEHCDHIDGRYIEAVACYASTCDLCGELTSHQEMAMDEQTQLGYCPSCVERARRLGILR